MLGRLSILRYMRRWCIFTKLLFDNPCLNNLPGNYAGPEGEDYRKSSLCEKAIGADNQQERLIKRGWVIGFVDGEGCFSIGFIRQPNRVDCKGYKTGYQVSHEFAVTQGAKSVSCLQELREFFGVGQVLLNKRYDNHKEHLYRYVVRSRKELLEVIIPFFSGRIQCAPRSSKISRSSHDVLS